MQTSVSVICDLADFEPGRSEHRRHRRYWSTKKELGEETHDDDVRREHRVEIKDKN